MNKFPYILHRYDNIYSGYLAIRPGFEIIKIYSVAIQKFPK
jgi:hypothetical protein